MRITEKRIINAFDHVSPDVLDAVLSRVNALKGEEPVTTQIINDSAVRFTKKDRSVHSRLRRAAAIAACLVLLVCGGIGLNRYELDHRVDSIVDLDVNPGIELQLNRRERVVDAVPLNDEARSILGDMDFKGADLNLSLNAIIGSMLRHGFITDAKNSILVSVDNADAARGLELQKRITEEINAILDASSLEGAILSQTVTTGDNVRSMAEAYGITPGKAQLITEIADADDRYTSDQLAGLSINELNLILSSRSLTLPGVLSEGQVSDKGYIGTDRAKEIALSHAGVTDADIYSFGIEMGYEQNQMVYEIEFDCEGYEYEYDINASTGAVVSSRKERDDDRDLRSDTGSAPAQIPAPQTDSDPGIAAAPENHIDAAGAKAIALDHAGVSEADIRNYKCEPDRENGAAVYDIEFDAGHYEYSYEISAATGAVLKAEKDTDDDAIGWESVVPQPAPQPVQQPAAPPQSEGGSGTAAAPENHIDAAGAKAIALDHAGVSEADIRNYKCEPDRENGAAVYDIEFDAGHYEYSYEINAATGAVISSEKEHND